MFGLSCQCVIYLNLIGYFLIKDRITQVNNTYGKITMFLTPNKLDQRGHVSMVRVSVHLQDEIKSILFL